MDELIKWAECHQSELEKRGIQTEKISVDEHGVYIDYATSGCIGRISMNEEGHVDIEIIEIESGISVMLAHYAFQDCFEEDLVASYIRILEQSNRKIYCKYHRNPIRGI